MTKSRTLKAVSHVIFDMDGVLLDTEGIYKNSIATIARRFGKIYTPEIQAKLIGTPERESSRIAVTEMNLPMSVDEFQHEFHTTSHKQFFNTPLMPGAAKLVQHLHRHKVPMAMATSSTQKSYKMKAAKHEHLFKLFHHIVCGGSDPEVKRGKPHPDIFLICAARFSENPKPDKCLVFEDSPNGVKSALSAGMQVIMMPDENVPLELQKDAHAKISSLEKAPLELFGLPPLKV